MSRRLGLLASLLCLSSCGKAPAPAVPSAGRLRAAVQSASAQPPCGAVIAMEWPATWPVPLEGGKYKILFYPLTGTPDTEPRLYTPAGEAVIDAQSGRPTSCAAFPGAPKELSRRRWPAATDKVGLQEFLGLEGKLYDRTEAVAAVYAAGRAPSAEDSAAAEEYLRLFESLAEPDLLPYYYRMNPGFWEWVRKAAGRSIPRA